MNVLPMRIPIQRALRAEEMSTILERINAADVTQLLNVAVDAVYNALLADLGLSLRGLPDGQQVDPRKFLIPARQHDQIRTAILNRSPRAGGQLLAISVIDLLPSTYDDSGTPTSADLAGLGTTAGGLQVSLTREAVWVITGAWHHIQALARQYGRHSQEHVEAATSWLSGLNQIINEASGPNVRVDRAAGDLSLLVHAGDDYAFTLIFHGDSRRCVAGDGCTAVIADDGSAHAPYPLTAVAEHEHAPSFPLEGPEPGTWSTHS
jgi:hypothetical protein